MRSFSMGRCHPCSMMASFAFLAALHAARASTGAFRPNDVNEFSAVTVGADKQLQSSEEGSLDGPSLTSVQKVHGQFNVQIENKTFLLDEEKFRCNVELASLEKQLADAEFDRSSAQTAKTEAEGKLMDKITEISALHEAWWSTIKSGIELKTTCQSNIDLNLNFKRSAMLNDSAVIGALIDGTSCESSAEEGAGSSLIQCLGGGDDDGGDPTVTVYADASMRSTAASLKTPTMRDLMDRTLEKIHKGAESKPVARPAFLMQKGVSSRSVGHLRAGVAVHLGGCIVASRPSCPQMLDMLMVMMGGADEEIEKLSAELVEEEQRCVNGRKQSSERISEIFQDIVEGFGKKTALMTKKDMAATAFEQAKKYLENLQQTYEQTKDDCTLSQTTLEDEICSLRKIRIELYKLIDMPDVSIIDCEMTEWTPGECSRECETGEQIFTRDVSLPTKDGAGCPPDERIAPCNTHACPIDCVVDDWSAWDECTAVCGGGISSRKRQVITEEQNRGEPCETMEVRECNTDPCNEDCQLGAWSNIEDTCSKACNGGHKKSRVRPVQQGKAAKGEGTCPAETSTRRLKIERCNMQECEPKSGDTLKCNSSVDVVLVLDGSGSLGEKGLAAVKDAGLHVIEALGPGTTHESAAAISVLVFGGPVNRMQYDRCKEGKGDLKEECGMNWVAHFTNKTDEAANALRNFEFPGTTSFAAQALASAKKELSNSRENVPSVVIVITDGHPVNKMRTALTAQDVKEEARLVWVTAGSAPREDIETWASVPGFPAQDNSLMLNSFEELTESATITNIIAMTCRDVV